MVGAAAEGATGLLGQIGDDRPTRTERNPSEADLGGVEALEPQVAEDACLDRTRSRTLLTLP